jgi:HSP20 family protein
MSLRAQRSNPPAFEIASSLRSSQCPPQRSMSSLRLKYWSATSPILIPSPRACFDLDSNTKNLYSLQQNLEQLLQIDFNLSGEKVMTLNRWDPLKDLLNFQEKVNRVMHATLSERCSVSGTCWSPLVDMLETPDAYVIRAELPGVSLDNVSVEIRNRRLTISGSRPFESEPSLAAYLSIERVHGDFERSFNLPGDVDVDAIKAKYTDGILEIHIPKAQEEAAAGITIVSLRS